MTATYTPSPLRVTTAPRLTEHPRAMEQLMDGLGNAVAECDQPEIVAALREHDTHPGPLAWERLVDEAIAEIAPSVADLMTAAIARRLPWTWEL